MISSEGASQDKHNGANFSSGAPSSGKLRMSAERNLIKNMDLSPWFQPKTEHFKKDTIGKGISRQISAL